MNGQPWILLFGIWHSRAAMLLNQQASMLPTGTIFTDSGSFPHLTDLESVWNGTNTDHQAVLILPAIMSTSATDVFITLAFQTVDIKQSFALTKTRRSSKNSSY